MVTKQKTKKVLRTTFQQRLEADSLKKFSLIMVIGFILIIVCCVIFYVVNIYATLQTDKKRIAENYNQLKEHFESSFEDSAAVLALDYVNGKEEERELYTTFYKMMTQENQRFQGRLLILDQTFQLLFDTEVETGKSSKLRMYLKTVYGHGESKGKILERVYLSPDKRHYLVLSQALIENNQVKGYLSVLIDGNSFQPDVSLAGVHYYLYDKYDNVFAMSTTYFLEGNLEKVSPNVQTGLRSQKSQLILADRSTLSDKLNLLVIKQENSVKPLLLVLFISMGVLFIVMILPVRAVARNFAQNNAQNVRLISREMEKVGGNSKHRFKIASGDEFESLATNINLMLNRIDSLYQHNIALIETNSLSERKKLEAQFNPHFLYNTLETIRIAIQYDPRLANDMILSLNVVLRYSISETENSVKIKDDINYLKHYLKIYDIRFEQLCYDIKMAEELENMTIPKLLLLPIIENSLKYGLLKRTDLSILIEIKPLENGAVLLSVADNGGGISREIVDQVNNGDYGNHHGLHNSKRRFLLAYPHSAFTLFSESNEVAVMMEIKKEDLENV